MLSVFTSILLALHWLWQTREKLPLSVLYAMYGVAGVSAWAAPVAQVWGGMSAEGDGVARWLRRQASRGPAKIDGGRSGGTGWKEKNRRDEKRDPQCDLLLHQTVCCEAGQNPIGPMEPFFFVCLFAAYPKFVFFRVNHTLAKALWHKYNNQVHCHTKRCSTSCFLIGTTQNTKNKHHIVHFTAKRKVVLQRKGQSPEEKRPESFGKTSNWSWGAQRCAPTSRSSLSTLYSRINSAAQVGLLILNVSPLISCHGALWPPGYNDCDKQLRSRRLTQRRAA